MTNIILLVLAKTLGWLRLVDTERSHLLSRALGQIDYACIDQAPGWWDWDVDCAGHDCGTCVVCTTDLTEQVAPELTIGDACRAVGTGRRAWVMDDFGDDRLMVQWEDEPFCRLVPREALER